MVSYRTTLLIASLTLYPCLIFIRGKLNGKECFEDHLVGMNLRSISSAISLVVIELAI